MNVPVNRAVTLPFLRASADAAPHESPLSSLPLTVLVGVTGVGKSTALAALQSANAAMRVLPDRREITDAVMIWPRAGGPVTDREERFRHTAEYRAGHSGGMAYALSTLLADTRHWGRQPVFDGLRGLEEVEYAATHFPAWRFVALGAPDEVRVRRLLGRADAFDQVSEGTGEDLRQALAELKGVQNVFPPAELDALASLTARGFTATEILAKVRIVVSERRNYDPQAAESFLRTLPPARALVLDTVELNPAGVAARVSAWAGERA
ncbi:AAA family ATPase [Deinococcus sp. QL22]|uniref:AAA family ATPase n=1 Tax=Deinococcus sp. QL22 TaxID=2939437 RepID=UPI0020173E84|nr:AAA family ATPase [Deinococcus sp. QL22]UQN05745.1 ATPase [Deinococcus sp. QL22]